MQLEELIGQQWHQMMNVHTYIFISNYLNKTSLCQEGVLFVAASVLYSEKAASSFVGTGF